MMERIYKMYLLGFGITNVVSVRNTTSKIIIKKIDVRDKHLSPEGMRDLILTRFVPKYSKINTSYKEDRKQLRRALQDQIKDLEDQIENLKLAAILCTKKVVEFSEQ